MFGLSASLLAVSLVPSQSGNAASALDAPPKPPPYTITAETPLEHVDAALLMDRVGRPDIARQQFAAALAANPSVETLTEIRNVYGTGALLTAARDPQLQPESVLLFDAVAAAIERDDADAASIDRLIARFKEGGDAAVQASSDARRRGRPIAIELLNRLADADAETRRAIVAGLFAIGPEAFDALSAATASSSPTVQSAVATALPQARRPDAIVELVRLEADPSVPPAIRAAASAALDPLSAAQLRVDPARTLRRAAIALLRGEQVPRLTQDAIVWDENAKRVVAVPLTTDAARLAEATRYAAAAARINPADAEAADLNGLLRLEANAADEAASGRDPVELLDAAMRLDLPKLAVQAARQIDDPSAVTSDGPLLAALDDPNREVQLAAAIAVARLAPSSPFAGSARAMQVLTAHIASGDRPRVVVTDPNTIRGNATGGKFAALGFDQSVTRTGREAVAVAAAFADTELVVVDPNAVRNPASTTLAELAADVRTREIPVVLLTASGLQRAAESATRNHPNATVAFDTDDLSYLRQQVVAVLPANASSAERTAARRRAAAALASIARRDDRTFSFGPVRDDVVTAVQRVDRLAMADVADILSAIGTPAARRQLLAMLSTAATEADTEAIREAARRQVERFPTLAL